MHATTLVIIYNYVLFGFRLDIIFYPIILYDLQYSDLFVYLIRDPKSIIMLYKLKQTSLYKRSLKSLCPKFCLNKIMTLLSKYSCSLRG